MVGNLKIYLKPEKLIKFKFKHNRNCGFYDGWSWELIGCVSDPTEDGYYRYDILLIHHSTNRQIIDSFWAIDESYIDDWDDLSGMAEFLIRDNNF